VRQPLLQVVGGADPGQPCPDDQDIDVLGGRHAEIVARVR
jgi:hypothetical protein